MTDDSYIHRRRARYFGPYHFVYHRTNMANSGNEYSVHVWFGPLGAHLYWPDVLKSRPDFFWGYIYVD